MDPKDCPRGPVTFYDLAAIKARLPETLLFFTCLDHWNIQDEGNTRRGRQAVRAGILEFFMDYDQRHPQPSWITQWVALVYNPSIGAWTTDMQDTNNTIGATQQLHRPRPDQYELGLQYFSRLLVNESDTSQDALRILNSARKKEGLSSTFEYGPGRRLSTELSELSGRDKGEGELELRKGEEGNNTEPTSKEKTLVLLSDDGSSTTYSEGDIYISLLEYTTACKKAKVSAPAPTQEDSVAVSLKRKREVEEDQDKSFATSMKRKREKSSREVNEEEEWMPPPSAPSPMEYMEISPEKNQVSTSMDLDMDLRELMGVSPLKYRKNPKKASQKSLKKTPQKSRLKAPENIFEQRDNIGCYIPAGPRWIPPSLPLPLDSTTGGANSTSSSAASTSTAPWIDDTYTSGPASISAPPKRRNERPEACSFHLWARTRPELCESTPYFRAFQGGVHNDSKSGLMGYLLDGHPSPGDIWEKEGRLIISHGGGGSAPDPKPTFSDTQDVKEQARPNACPERYVPTFDVAHMRNTADPVLELAVNAEDPSESFQLPNRNTSFISNSNLNTPSSSTLNRPSLKRDQLPIDTSIKKLLQAKARSVPVVLIVGKDYRWWPLQMRPMGDLEETVGAKDDGRARYAVLGWYMIRDAWEELEPEAVDCQLLAQSQAHIRPRSGAEVQAKAKAVAKAETSAQAQSVADKVPATVGTEDKVSSGLAEGANMEVDDASGPNNDSGDSSDADSVIHPEFYTRLFVRWKFAFEWIEAQGEPWWIKDVNGHDNDRVPPTTNDGDDDLLMKMDEDDKDMVLGAPSPHSDSSPRPEPMPNLDAPFDQEPINTTHIESDATTNTFVYSNAVQLSGEAGALNDHGEPTLFDSDLPSPVTSNTSHHLEFLASTIHATPNPPKLGRKCDNCGWISPRIYFEGWFCTNSACRYHSMLLDGRLSTQITLSYSKEFLSRPALPQPIRRSMKGSYTEFLDTSEAEWSVIPLYRPGSKSFEREHWQGLSCQECGRLNSRIDWRYWTCAACQHTIQPVPAIAYHASQFYKPELRSPKDFVTTFFTVERPQLERVSEWADVYSCDLPDGGSVLVLRPLVLDRYDQLFQDYQQDAMKRKMLSRVPLKSSFVAGTHTSHFIHNAGAHYSYVCRVLTDAFEDCPQSVLAARKLLQDSVTEALGESITFNEILTCAYKNEQSMGFHSDSEPGVQRIIASVSLGSSATMSFRKKAQKNAKEKLPVCFEITLRHGDTLIMNGADIQKNYEHRVVPSGLRFAATARLILAPPLPTIKA